MTRSADVKNKFDSWLQSVENAPKSGGTKSASCGECIKSKSNR